LRKLSAYFAVPDQVSHPFKTTKKIIIKMVKPIIIAVIYINLRTIQFLTQIQNLGITNGSISRMYNKPNLVGNTLPEDETYDNPKRVGHLPTFDRIYFGSNTVVFTN
jgi:hypothetical protein